MSNELESLLVSGKDIDKKLVAEILSPYLKIDKDTCEIRPTSSWDSLKVNIKILLLLLARKAMIALELGLSQEPATATEIMENTGLKKGSVNPALRALYDDKMIAQNEDKEYFIPNHSIEKIKNIIISSTNEKNRGSK
jgi:DNA-binding transcriptional ArsR family regulator